VNAVVVDATYVLLHSGNWEIYGIRDRESQTLYISDLIYTPQPGGPASGYGYGQLQVGFFIACIRDTRDRASLMKQELQNEENRTHMAQRPPKSSVMTAWDRVYDTPPREGEGIALQRMSAQRPKIPVAPLPTKARAVSDFSLGVPSLIYERPCQSLQKNLLERLTSQMTTLVVKKKSAHIQPPYSTDRYMRHFWDDGVLTMCPSTFGSDSLDFIDLGAASSELFERAKGATGLHQISIEGVPFTGVGTDCSGKFLVKYAKVDFCIQRLCNQFSVYDSFRRAGVMGRGLPELVGLFSQAPSPDHEEAAIIPPVLLILEYTGQQYEVQSTVPEKIR